MKTRSCRRETILLPPPTRLCSHWCLFVCL